MDTKPALHKNMNLDTVAHETTTTATTNSSSALMEKQQTSPVFLGMLTLGFGLYLAWQNILMSPSLLPPTIEGYAVGNWFYLQDLLFIALLAVGALIAHKHGTMPHKKTLFWASALLLCLCTILQYYCAYGTTLYYSGAIFGYILSISRAGIILLWGEMLCTVSPRDALVSISGGYAIGFLINLVVAAMNPLGAEITHSALPLLSALVFNLLRFEPMANKVVKSNPRVMLPHFPYALLIGMGLFGFVMRLLFDYSEMRVSNPNEAATIYAGIIIASMVTIGAILYKREIGYAKLSRLLMPAIVIIALIIALTESGSQAYEAFAIGCVWIFYKIFSWAIARAVAYKTSVAPITVFAIANILLNIFTYLPLLVLKFFPLPKVEMIYVAAIVVSALLIAVFLLREEQIDKVFSKDEQTMERIVRINREGSVGDCINLASAEFGLTEREREIATKVLQGESNDSILGELYISKNTLRTHMHNIYDKTDTHSREELISLLLGFKTLE